MFVTAAFLTRLGLLWLGPTFTAVPAGACRVELVPDDAPRVWIAAATALRESLRGAGAAAADRDCRQVVIHASLERPSVEVTTLDGRRGVRRLADARDVEPTVTALIITVLADPTRVPAGVGDGTVARAAAPARSGSDGGGWHPQIVAGGGARLSLPGTPAPLLELGIGIGRPGWEIGLAGAWAPTTIGTGSAAAAGFASSAEVAIGGARRQALGESGVDLILGARAGVIRFVNDDNTQSTTDNPDLSGVAPAATAFLGAAFPTHASVRFRPQLWFQWAAATRLGGAAADSRPASVASVGLSIGAESRLP